MNLTMTANGMQVPLDDAALETSPHGGSVRYRAIVGVSPSVAADRSHRHLSRKGHRRRDLLAVPDVGDAVPLEWRDTDKVSWCPSNCDGDHETWYVQELRCPLCGVALDTVAGEDTVWVGQGMDVTLRASLPLDAVSTEVVVAGIAPEPVTFHGEVRIDGFEQRATFTGRAWVPELLPR